MRSLRRLVQSPSFWPLQIGGWLFYWVMLVVTFLPTYGPERAAWPLIETKAIRAFVGFLITCGLRKLLSRFAMRASAGRAASVVIASATIGGLLWMAVMTGLILPLIRPVIAQTTLVERLADPREALDYSLTLLAWCAIYLGILWWQELQDQRARALEAATLAQQAQLDALRYQLNPHFLFNGLNSIRALIEEDASRARRMVTALSEFLRYPLTSAAGSDVPLSTEIDAIRNYLAIEQIRFEDRLRVTIDIARDADSAAIPSFLLHPLVENAITHGFASTSDGMRTLSVRIAARVRDGQLWLEVVNSGRWRPTHASAERRGTGTGLRNVQSRLAAIAPDAHRFSIDEEDDCVAVRLALPFRSTPQEEDEELDADAARR
jgi:two-component system LytT family sensor kinase